MRRAAWLALLALVIALPAAALEAPKDYAGAWILSGVSEGAESCTITLTVEEAIGGWGLTLADDCQGKFELSEDIAAWTVYPGGAIGFIDPLRHVLLKFEPSEIGGYVAQPALGEPLALDRPRADVELTEQQRMSGLLTLNGFGGVMLCAWDSTASENGLSGTLKASGPCTAPWRAAVRWTRGELDLRLIDRRGKVLVVLRGESVFGFYSPPDSEPLLAFGRVN